MKTARRIQSLMTRLSGTPAEIRRASESARTYWAHCPALDALGEQIVLEQLPEGMLMKVEEATYKRSAPPVFVPTVGLLAHVRSFLGMPE